MSIKLGFSDISLWLDWFFFNYVFNVTEAKLIAFSFFLSFFFFASYQVVYVLSYSILDVIFDHLIKIKLAIFLHCEVSVCNYEVFRRRLPRWLSSRPGFKPLVGKIPWRRAWQPTPIFLPSEIPWNRGVWQAMVDGVAKSWTQLR